MIPEKVKKYLNKYSSDHRDIEHAGLDNIDNVIVIPAINESENIKDLFASIAENDGKYFSTTLLLFVVNNSEKANEDIKADNKKTLDYLSSIIKKMTGHFDNFQEKLLASGLRIALIDASSQGKVLSAKDAGVGLARKIGMDAALKIFNYESSLKKLLICLDADCQVDKNYLTEIADTFNQKSYHAGFVKFEHKIPDNKESAEAIICYEIFLRYYVLGLMYANSPYAFHTVGSTMVCDYESYIKIGGMNKKKAAEDFYFLEKLSKIVNIDYIKSTCIYPSARKSWRVPFGTGQRVNRFFAKTHPEYFLYDTVSFEILKRWNNVFYNEESKSANDYLSEAKKINTELYNFLLQQKFSESWGKILTNTANSKQILNQKKYWFDGFRTLKLIHHLRDSLIPQINMFDAIDNLFKMSNVKFDLKRSREKIPGLKTQIKYLEVLRDLT